MLYSNMFRSILVLVLCAFVLAKDFTYPTYTFKKKSPWARKYKNREADCREKSCQAEHMSSLALNLEQLECVRKCVSHDCYDKMYAWDILEEGEVDVRATSFKGCVAVELKMISEQEYKDAYEYHNF